MLRSVISDVYCIRSFDSETTLALFDHASELREPDTRVHRQPCSIIWVAYTAPLLKSKIFIDLDMCFLTFVGDFYR